MKNEDHTGSDYAQHNELVLPRCHDYKALVDFFLSEHGFFRVSVHSVRNDICI